MSKAKETFDQAILDAENLLRHFNVLNTHPPPPEVEVLKRAGLIMAMTAWETYVEDRLLEATETRLQGVSDPTIVKFVQSRLSAAIKRLHNPTSDTTIQLFREYADVNLAESWKSAPDAKGVGQRLDGYLKLRGEVVHRSRPISNGPPIAHPVKKQDLEKVISFLKRLVNATEKAVSGQSPNV